MGFPIALLTTCALALALNVPLGIWRARVVRLSLQWFLAIHLAVPVVIALRLTLGVEWHYAPLLIAMAVLGQGMGGWAWRRRSLAASPIDERLPSQGPPAAPLWPGGRNEAGAKDTSRTSGDRTA